MTDWVEWFRAQLDSSGQGFIWAFEQIEPELHRAIPPVSDPLGLWPPARHVWHVAGYERWIALPSMRQWVGDPIPDGDAWVDTDETWAAVQDQPVETFVEAFRAVRAEQIQLLDELTAVDWTTPRETLWGMWPLARIVTKTYQHTFEHGDTLLRMVVWWRDIEGQIARYKQQQSQGAS
jgi:hypothetical protein